MNDIIALYIPMHICMQLTIFVTAQIVMNDDVDMIISMD